MVVESREIADCLCVAGIGVYKESDLICRRRVLLLGLGCRLDLGYSFGPGGRLDLVLSADRALADERIGERLYPSSLRSWHTPAAIT